VIALLLIAAAAGETRARIGEIEVTGPARDLVLSLGQSAETRIEGELLAGERARLVVPLAARGQGPPSVAPRITWPVEDPLAPAGSARFLGWSADTSGIDRLPPGIVARPRPPAGPDEIELPVAVLALLPAAFLLALLARERRTASVLVSLAGAALCGGWAARDRSRAASGISVLELAQGSGVGLEVRAQFATATLAAAELPATALEVDPEGARVVWVGSFAPGSSWQARSRGSALYLLRARDWTDRSFTREKNELADLAETWLREEGEWTARGAWTLGTPLPPPRSGAAPPGWLSSGLPQGIPVLLGRIEPASGGREEAWIRLTGLR
jgi:hypothetical protein